MLINFTTKVRNVSGLTPDEEQRILDFLYGMVYAQCANAPNEWFSARTFLGGTNFEWRDIPLIVLFNKYKKKGNSDSKAVDLAGIDAGNLLKKVIANEPSRKFETKYEKRINQYKWIKK